MGRDIEELARDAELADWQGEPGTVEFHFSGNGVIRPSGLSIWRNPQERVTCSSPPWRHPLP